MAAADGCRGTEGNNCGDGKGHALSGFRWAAMDFRVDMAGSLVKNDPDGLGTIRLWQGIRQFLE